MAEESTSPRFTSGFFFLFYVIAAFGDGVGLSVGEQTDRKTNGADDIVRCMVCVSVFQLSLLRATEGCTTRAAGQVDEQFLAPVDQPMAS